MKNISNHKYWVIAAFAAAVLGGCVTVDQGVVDEVERLPNLPTKEAQEALVAGLQPVAPRVRVLRTLDPPRPERQGWRQPVEMAGTAEARVGAIEATKIASSKTKSDWPAAAPPGTERVVFVNGDEGVEYELEFSSAELAALGAAVMARGINDASEGGVNGEPVATPYGWSNGIDSRVQKPINATYPLNQRELMRIGELNGGGCSGALIGRRLVLTAAHCVVPSSLNFSTQTYRARRSGAQMPFGAVSTNSFWYSGNWIPNNCHITRAHPLCSQHDWAILILPDNAWAASPNGTPGWMGYWVYSQSYIAANSVSNNNGYPACSMSPPWNNDPPVGCVNNQPYGQNFSGTATGFLLPHDNVPSYYRTSVDISGGHSGSPNWTDYPGSNGPYVIGIAMFEHCSGANCASLSGDLVTHPNGYRGMTPWLANFISTQRAAYP